MHVFYLGNTLNVLKHLPEKSVQCCPTSPPYFGLRDYGLPATNWPAIEYTPMAGLPTVNVPAWSGCLGLEPTPELYIAHMVLIFREVWRVLRDDGTCFLNIGDSYARSGGTQGGGNRELLHLEGKQKRMCKIPAGELKTKDLLGIPWRLAFALQAEGWYLRSDIIWEKPNAMPESVKDRPTKSHEYLFLLAKSEKYYYDTEAIKEPCKYDNSWSASDTKTAVGQGGKHGKTSISKKRWEGNGKKNKRTVWSIPTKPFKGAHYAVFPPDLIEPCILAGSKQGDTVLDPFGGSGTVAMKCNELGRDSIYIDMSPNYLGDALRRGKYSPAEYDIL